jgi:hypothetical protein
MVREITHPTGSLIGSMRESGGLASTLQLAFIVLAFFVQEWLTTNGEEKRIAMM